jgi:His/Glu/Gln/Arg/opine family amino acid ABC transporter permease subunit
MATAGETLKPPRVEVGLIGWLRKNLFSTWYNALLTLVILWLLVTFIKNLSTWALVTARWEVVSANLRLFMVGQYPPDQMWRVGLCVLIISFLFGLSWGVWGGTLRAFAVTLAAAYAVLAVLPFALNVRLWLAANVIIIVIGYPLGRLLAGRAGWVVLGWALSLPVVMLIIQGFRLPSLLALLNNFKVFLIAPYLLPADVMGRVYVGVAWMGLLVGLSWGTWKPRAGRLIASLALMAGVAFLFQLGLQPGDPILGVPLPRMAPLMLALAAALGLGYQLGRGRTTLARWVALAWGLSVLPLIYLWLGWNPGFGMVQVLPEVNSNFWGGLLLTFLLSIVGIVASFPLGVLLALGRRSNLPVVRGFSIVFIEVVRGVPLVTILFMAQIMLPLFLPEGMRIDRVLRAMAGIVIFSAAYTAENVRGGLQAVPEGQVEAAKALGLSGPLITLLIVLPQALRAVIPANVGQFISLFKDTTLVAIVGLLELLGIGRAVLANPEWLGLYAEVYLFIAVVYGVFSYSMSYASYRLEAALGVGER